MFVLLKMCRYNVLRYSAAQQIIDWIIDTNTVVDINNWNDFEQYYGMKRCSTNNFMYPKEDYINIVKTLPFMMIEILFICLCDKVFDNTS